MANNNFSMPVVIEKKKRGQNLTEEEIKGFISGVVDGTVTPAQIGAFLMAVYFQGMSDLETKSLLSAMVHSGETFKWPKEWKGLLVDKHSTGGVGDKVSLVLAPALAALGLKVPMISGRGLGPTGGTLDKLESIPGYQVQLPAEKIRKNLETVGCAIVGQTKSIVPADKALYAIRDVTSTVDSNPMIVGSILSKKLAENIDALVMEMTYGRSCFMKTKDDARNLGNLLIKHGKEQGLKVSAMLVHMDDPLGMTVGNALEVKEAIQCMNGKAEKDLKETICKLGGQLLVDTGKASNLQEGADMIEGVLKDGSARTKFHDMMIAQGVAKDVAKSLVSEEFSCLAAAKSITSLKAHKTGTVHGINAMSCAMVAHQLGGGRKNEGDVINPAVGIELVARVGDQISEGQDWLKVHHDTELTPEQLDLLAQALELSETDTPIRNRVTEIIVP